MSGRTINEGMPQFEVSSFLFHQTIKRSCVMKAMVYHGVNDIRFEENHVLKLLIRPTRW